MKKLISKTKLGDMQLLYILDTETDIIGMCLAPADKEIDIDTERKARVQSIVECKIIGDKYPGHYFGGLSMKYSETTARLKFSEQKISTENAVTQIRTFLKTNDNLEAVHTVTHSDGAEYITVTTEFINNSEQSVTLEMLSSFAIYGISPYLDGTGENRLILHRMKSKWSMEGRIVSESFENLLLEDSWTMGNAFNLRFGQVGSMPVKDYFPFAAVEDTKNNILWGVQMGCPSSWQIEITRSDDCAAISGGIADREFGHWMKKLRPGESFNPASAVLSVCSGDIDDICQRLTSAQSDRLNVPDSENALPVIFNEYCTTWGCPSHENINGILNAIDGMGIDYFIIDCGWFKADGVRWDISMGDYIPSESLFPEGIDTTVKLIKSHGMRPGIWFEFENVGCMADAYNITEHMLSRDGITLTTANRRFWDMNDPWVKEYLNERVIEFLKRNDFGYIKVDYNETIGIGCDHPDSLGEGLRHNMEGTIEFYKKMRREIPDLVIENCASGGNRLEPVFMGLSSMASFSDAHECVEIPIIAANLHRAILPRQSQIWCVIRRSDGLRRIAYSMAASCLGRLCLSGDVTELSADQRQLIINGINFYKKATPYIKNGKSHILRNGITSYRHPEGWQAVTRENKSGTLLVVHTFKNCPPEISVPVNNNSIKAVFMNGTAKLEIENGYLTLRNLCDFSGIGIILE
ncbi:MAG: alpha-galactosidase [Oscillospiraceae bacterium]|nr:alpha-galactosidase [Oscillospiraceae bacterium]